MKKLLLIIFCVVLISIAVHQTYISKKTTKLEQSIMKQQVPLQKQSFRATDFTPQSIEIASNPLFEPYSMVGVLIKGRVMDVVEQFENKGFTMAEHNPKSIVHQDNINTYQIIMKGKGHLVGLRYNIKTQAIYICSLFMPVTKNWHYLLGAYTSTRSGLIKLYGGVTSDRDFTSFYKPYRKGDRNEIQAILTNNCKYKSYWSLPNVTLSVTIGNTCQVGVIAELKYNSITLE